MGIPRTSPVAVTEEVVRAMMDRLPPDQIRHGSIIQYNKHKFGRSPSWVEGKALVGCISKLFDHTDGKNTTQHCLSAGMITWNKIKDMKLSEEELLKGSYRIRAMVSQLRDHKKKGRKVPASFIPSFACIWHKIFCDEADTEIVVSDAPDDDSSDDDDSTDDDTEKKGGKGEALCSAEVLSSNNPRLLKLLQCDGSNSVESQQSSDVEFIEPSKPSEKKSTPPNAPPLATIFERRRLWVKTTPGFAPQSGWEETVRVGVVLGAGQSLTTAQMKALADSSQNVAAPSARDWGTLQVDLKEAQKRKRGTPGKPKAKKATLEAKPRVESRRAEMKREHSKAYHAAMKAAKDAGMPEDIRKKMAREAGANRAKEWRLLQRDWSGHTLAEMAGIV